MKTFSITEAEAKLPKLMKWVEAGERVVLTREGDVVAEFIAVRPTQLKTATSRRRPGRFKNAGPAAAD